MGEPLAITCDRPQTTREQMLGIWTTEDFQAILVDTPGLHQAKSALNQHMVEEAARVAKDADLLLMLAEMPLLTSKHQLEEWSPGPGARSALATVQQEGTPIVLLLTKVDRCAQMPKGLGDLALEAVLARWAELASFCAALPVAALEGRGLEELRDCVRAHLPQGPMLFDPEQLSDRDMRWHASEWIRLELTERLGAELPYSAAVVVRDYKELRNSDRIEASIHVERESQKGIVIGKGGQVIRAISAAARERIARLTGRRCDLYLDVRVTKNWTKDPKKLGSLGYVSRNARNQGRR